MITKQDIQEAIAECQNTRNPNASTCMKLASFYTIYDHMFEETQDEGETQEPCKNGVSYESGLIAFNGKSEFAKVINGQDTEKILRVIDELVEALQVLNPRLYNNFIEKLKR